MHAFIIFAALLSAADTPIGLNAQNPHYFQFRGKPTILIGSTEHYGAVLNLDFDAGPYLDELAANGLNLTRTFSGTYRESPGIFRIRDNTLAPKPGRFACPWARAGEQFDLDRYDDAYFERLKAFVREAGKRGIVVEYVLFCPLYEEELWAISPMNAKNNVQGVGKAPRKDCLSLKDRLVYSRQLAFARKAVQELNAFDNVYYEICNEPYFANDTLAWQREVSDTIVETESKLPNKHMIAQNISNGSAKIESPDPNVSLFNFHYAAPPDAVGINYGLNKAIGDDETGFRGTGDRVYRQEAWEFLLAGGSLFDHLDYSFTTDHEDGTAKVEDPTPGGGGRAFRRQMKTLGSFLNEFDFLRMKPDSTFILSGVPAKCSARVLSEPGKQYAVYLSGGGKATLTLKLPAGNYAVRWIDPVSGKVLGEGAVEGGEKTVLESPAYSEDVALRMVSPVARASRP